MPSGVLAVGMDVTIEPSAVGGTATAPPSKSYTHRAVLAAGYAGGTTVRDALVSADTRATMGAVDGLVVLTGDASLRSRPHGPLLAAIEDLGGRAESTRRNGQAPLVVGGPIPGGAVSMPGDVSSQFVTALLMAGAATPEGIDVELTTPLKSAPYVDITIEVLDAFGVTAERTDAGFRVGGGQRYAAEEYRVPGDFSSISYLLAAGALAADDSLQIEGAVPSAQGDTAAVSILERMGADIDWDREGGVLAVSASALEGVEVDVGDTPDLLPTVAAVGAAAGGTTRIINCEHVRYKETDRVSAMAEELEKLGAAIEEREDELLVHGEQTNLEGARVDGRGDHRIVMALAVAALVADGATTIAGSEHVDVSFPGFFDVFADLGVPVQRD